ncbi:MAG TPA: hypothetical protein VMT02_00390 [Burkholderiales bacterium]|jgi:hypothetical protein|nr:hypothetical protein [Burkholderiales bacterium]
MNRISWIAICAGLSVLQGCPGPGPFGDRSEPKKADAGAMKPAPPPTREQIVEAFTRLNKALEDAYERIIKERGSRTVPASRAVAFDALNAGLARLGMIVENRDPDLGFLAVAAPAPRPLDAAEWRTTVQSDLPLMAGILCPVLGEYCKTIKFEPEDYVIVINATTRTLDADRSLVSLTTRMREIRPRPGVPRREYPPPTGVQMALDKIWAEFDRALAERQARR